MPVKVIFHDVDRSEALLHFINSKSNDLKKFLWRGEHFHWVVERDADKLASNLHLKLRNKRLKVSAKARNAFSASEEAFEKAKRVVKEDHARLRFSS